MFYKERLHLCDSQKPQTRPAQLEQSGLKLFVGGLNKSTSEEVLFQYFSQFGDVSHVEIARSPNRKSKGYRYVWITDPESAKKILGRPQQYRLHEHLLRVEDALQEHQRTAIHRELAARRLYLSGIPSKATENDVIAMLKPFGHLVRITKLRRSNPYSNPNSFYCYVTMDRPQAVERILEHPGFSLDGRQLICIKPFAAISRDENCNFRKEFSFTDQRDSNQEELHSKASLPTLPSPTFFLRPLGKNSPHQDIAKIQPLVQVATTLFPQIPRFVQQDYFTKHQSQRPFQANLDSKVGLRTFCHNNQNLRFNLRRPADSGRRAA